MTTPIRKTAYSLILGMLMLSLLFACNSKKTKKDDAAKEDTIIKVEPVPDTTQMDKDTADVRPVDPVKPGE